MINNTECAYCGIAMNRIENDDGCLSVEHMIPNSASRSRRKNCDGDFNVCRRCNIKKSRMDEIMGITTRLALGGETSQKDADKFRSKIEKNDKLFIRAAKSIAKSADGYGISLPISVSQAIEYFEHFAKGQYLIKNKKVYDGQDKLIIIDIHGYHIVKGIVSKYIMENQANPFDDLMQNKNDGVYNLEGETFIISSDDASDMAMFFNRSLLIRMNIVAKTRGNLTMKNKVRRSLRESWVIS